VSGGYAKWAKGARREGLVGLTKDERRGPADDGAYGGTLFQY
jgi:hypothetical protein